MQMFFLYRFLAYLHNPRRLKKAFKANCLLLVRKKSCNKVVIYSSSGVTRSTRHVFVTLFSCYASTFCDLSAHVAFCLRVSLN